MIKKSRNRKSRKVKKSRKNKGGSPTPIREPILFTVTGMDLDKYPNSVLQFFPNMAFGRLLDLKEYFIQSVNNYKNFEPEDETVLDEDIQIHKISGTADVVVFEGKIADWSNIQMQTFLSDLKVGDRVHIEIIQS